MATHASSKDPIQSFIVFCFACKDKILTQGHRRSRKGAYWLEVVTQRHYPQVWQDHNALFGANFKYVSLERLLQGALEKAPKFVRTAIAQNNLKPNP